jgi:hypothetical protein
MSDVENEKERGLHKVFAKERIKDYDAISNEGAG